MTVMMEAAEKQSAYLHEAAGKLQVPIRQAYSRVRDLDF